MISDKSAQQIREEVSAAYTRAVSSPRPSCCGKDACCEEDSAGVAVQLAGYTPQQLAELPPEAATNAFGCGNPLAFGDVEPGDVVLDLGAGAGIDVILAARKVGPTGRAIGVDMTDAMIERARRAIADAGLANAEIRKGIIEELPLEAASVDWVISNCVINLSPDKQRVFAEIARVLKSGGRMLVSDIVVEELPAWARESADLYCSCIAGAISEHAYLDGLRAAGLADVEVKARAIYDRGFIAGLLDSELADPATGRPIPEDIVRRAAVELDGKVWSAQFTARKP